MLNSLIGIRILSYLLQGMGLRGEIQFEPQIFMLAIAAGIILSVVASINPAVKTSKLNIVHALKYE